MEYEDFDNGANEGDLFDENDFFDDQEESLDKIKAGKDGDKNDAKDAILESVWEKSENLAKEKAKKQTERIHPKLTERELSSDKGLIALKEMFDSCAFPSKSGPYEKLDKLLGDMEYWAHNLFPLMNFDDCLAKIEQLGRKRAIKNYMRKLRHGFSLDEEPIVADDAEDDGPEKPSAAADENDNPAEVNQDEDDGENYFVDDWDPFEKPVEPVEKLQSQPAEDPIEIPSHDKPDATVEDEKMEEDSGASDSEAEDGSSEGSSSKNSKDGKSASPEVNKRQAILSDDEMEEDTLEPVPKQTKIVRRHIDDDEEDYL